MKSQLQTRTLLRKTYFLFFCLGPIAFLSPFQFAQTSGPLFAEEVRISGPVEVKRDSEDDTDSKKSNWKLTLSPSGGNGSFQDDVQYRIPFYEVGPDGTVALDRYQTLRGTMPIRIQEEYSAVKLGLRSSQTIFRSSIYTLDSTEAASSRGSSHLLDHTFDYFKTFNIYAGISGYENWTRTSTNEPQFLLQALSVLVVQNARFIHRYSSSELRLGLTIDDRSKSWSITPFLAYNRFSQKASHTFRQGRYYSVASVMQNPTLLYNTALIYEPDLSGLFFPYTIHASTGSEVFLPGIRLRLELSSRLYLFGEISTSIDGSSYSGRIVSEYYFNEFLGVSGAFETFVADSTRMDFLSMGPVLRYTF